MPDIKLPNGKKIPFTKEIDGFEIAKKISKSLKSKDKQLAFEGLIRMQQEQLGGFEAWEKAHKRRYQGKD